MPRPTQIVPLDQIPKVPSGSNPLWPHGEAQGVRDLYDQQLAQNATEAK